MTGQKYYKFVTRELTDSKRGIIDYSRIGEWISCDDIKNANINGAACGHGLHLMKIPNPCYCPYDIGFLAEGRYLMGEDDEKARFAEVRLIRPLKFSEIFFPGANLRRANLRGANLRNADLGGANLRNADLGGANLWGANLRNADLGGANLRGANLRCANLLNADLGYADLWGVKIDGAVGLSDSIISRIKGEEAEKQ